MYIQTVTHFCCLKYCILTVIYILLYGVNAGLFFKDVLSVFVYFIEEV